MRHDMGGGPRRSQRGASVSDAALQSPLYDAESTQAVLREATAALRRARTELAPETDAAVGAASADNVFVWTPLLATLAPYASPRAVAPLPREC